MPDVTRIIEQKATESIYNDDFLLLDRPTEGEDGGTRKILVSRLKELLCGDYIADEWVAGETYANGAIVSHEGKLYYNKSGGALVQTTFDSNAWLEVKIDELLEKVIGSVGEKWRLVDTYHYDDLVVYGGRLYRCIKTTSTQGTWVSNEWIEANAEYYFKKVREYIARYGFVPSREAVSSPYNKGDLILYRAPGDTTNSLYMRLNDTEYGDPTWIPENWLNVGNIGGALSKIYDDMEESSCDVQIKEQSIVDENNVADLTSLAAVGSASGAIATFDDGSDLPMPKLEVAIEPQQDLHGYDSPWVGGAGKNKLNLSTRASATVRGITSEVKADNTIVASGTSTGNGDIICPVGTPFTMVNGETYTISLNGTDIRDRILTIFIGTSYINISSINSGAHNITFTLTRDVLCNQVMFRASNGATVNINAKLQIEKGSTATSYAPYSNICPISGWDEVNVEVSGKNWFDIDAEHSTISESYLYNFTVKPNTAYTMSSNVPFNNPASLYFNGGASNVNGVGLGTPRTFTSDANGHLYAYVRFTASDGAVDLYTAVKDGTYYIQLEEGESATTYEPYNGQTYTIDLDGTRYGGTLDVVSGVLTVDRAYVDMGSLTWTYQSAQTVFSTIISGLKRGILICSNYKYTDVNFVERMNDGEIWDKSNAFSPTNVVVKDLRYTDAATFKTAMNGVQLVYNLATPLTIQLTPTQVNSLLGVNNIYADTGDVLDAEYIRDMTTIINYLIARIEALENQ